MEQINHLVKIRESVRFGCSCVRELAPIAFVERACFTVSSDYPFHIPGERMVAHPGLRTLMNIDAVQNTRLILDLIPLEAFQVI